MKAKKRNGFAVSLTIKDILVGMEMTGHMIFPPNQLFGS